MFTVRCFKVFIDPYTAYYIEIVVLLGALPGARQFYNGFYIGYSTLNVIQAHTPRVEGS
jgi:hypothetical protein